MFYTVWFFFLERNPFSGDKDLERGEWKI